jgi:hypothetical protein
MSKVPNCIHLSTESVVQPQLQSKEANMAVPKLDSAVEERLTTALGEISRLTESGQHPNDAICKVASERQVPQGHIQLLVNAYNTGRTQYQLQSSTNPLEKAASFPLADAAKILEQMFPTEVKSAAALSHAQAVSGDYDVSPGLLLTAWRYAMEVPATLKKCAAAEKPPVPVSSEAENAKIAEAYKQAQRELENAQHAETKLAYESAAAIGLLQDYFRLPQALPFQNVRTNSLRQFGKAAELLFAEISEQQPQLAKQASALHHRVAWDQAPYSLVQLAINKAQDYVQAVNAIPPAEQALALAKEAFYGPFGTPADLRIQTGSIWDRSSAGEKQAVTGTPMGMNTPMAAGAGAALSGAVRGLVDNLMPPKEDLVRGQLNSLQDPAHEDHIRTIRTQAMLADLLKNDPVISGYQPNQVYDAFNRISEVVPHATQSSMITRALVRRYLEQSQNVDPFEIDQMMNVENKMREQMGPPAGSPSRPITVK